MARKLKDLLQTLNKESEKEPLVLAVAALFLIYLLGFLFLIIVIAVKFLGILFIPVVALAWSAVMITIDYRREKGE